LPNGDGLERGHVSCKALPGEVVSLDRVGMAGVWLNLEEVARAKSYCQSHCIHMLW
jgi:hypothetical protein